VSQSTVDCSPRARARRRPGRRGRARPSSKPSSSSSHAILGSEFPERAASAVLLAHSSRTLGYPDAQRTGPVAGPKKIRPLPEQNPAAIQRRVTPIET
jgi:hypothetical protein